MGKIVKQCKGVYHRGVSCILAAGSSKQQTFHTDVSGPCLLCSLSVACYPAPTNTALAPHHHRLFTPGQNDAWCPGARAAPRSQGCALVFVCNTLTHFAHVNCSPLKVVILDWSATCHTHIWTARCYHLLGIESCWSYALRLK